MITSVSLNPSIDKAIAIAQFVYGGMNRAVSVREDLAGKAINVAIVSSSIGVQTSCIGFLCQDNGKQFENKLMAHGVHTDFVWLEGAVRTNVKLLDQSKGIVTEINEAGTRVSESAIEQLMALVSEHAAESDYLILSGSLPPGCPKDLYKSIIHSVEGLNCRCVLDAEGEVLARGIEAKPFMIKPNLHELSMFSGREFSSIEEIGAVAREITKGGIEYVVVSMGAKGALLVSAEEALYAEKMEVAVGSTVGAGDSMVAGIVAGFWGEYPLERIMRMGVAAATASVMTQGTKLLDKRVYKDLIDEITIKRVDIP